MFKEIPEIRLSIILGSFKGLGVSVYNRKVQLVKESLNPLPRPSARKCDCVPWRSYVFKVYPFCKEHMFVLLRKTEIMDVSAFKIHF